MTSSRSSPVLTGFPNEILTNICEEMIRLSGNSHIKYFTKLYMLKCACSIHDQSEMMHLACLDSYRLLDGRFWFTPNYQLKVLETKGADIHILPLLFICQKLHHSKYAAEKALYSIYHFSFTDKINFLSFANQAPQDSLISIKYITIMITDYHNLDISRMPVSWLHTLDILKEVVALKDCRLIEQVETKEFRVPTKPEKLPLKRMGLVDKVRTFPHKEAFTVDIVDGMFILLETLRPRGESGKNDDNVWGIGYLRGS
ncbi:hypothetical protein BS50DRAFT_589952 [Corynespora cassiicola Philippines]|uniref:Uncharacterized protein n=1 Tax=Corynespora cassiicola Philippines TaxID=1448308 RepID=A0A2T2NJF1_CORCC|nr:hypothetical protein BS50DRAFT_589952 [Corynespora cassiicola Philippines]